MKARLITLIIPLLTWTALQADLNGNGYYRFMNYGSSRWANLIDNQASVDFFAGTADLHSLQLTNDTEQILGDPGSIVLLTNEGGNQYDIAAQGCSLESLVNNPISIQADGNAPDGQTLYRIYGTYQGVTKYIGDANIFTGDEYGRASLNVTNAEFNKWYVMPLDATGNNYFGTTPTVNSNGVGYTSLFTSFPYEMYSEGLKAFYIGRVGYGMVEMIEITDGVPAGFPVIIQCGGQNISENRFQILESMEAIPGNSLSGVYFDYSGSPVSNQLLYDARTMRVLGLCQDGSLGFVTSDLVSVPANSAYLKVPAGSSPEFKCVTPEEFDANIPEAPEYFYFDSYQLLPQDGYNYTGTFEIPAPTGSDKNIKLRFYSSSNEDDFIGAYSTDDNDVRLNMLSGENLPFQYGCENYWVLPNWKGGDLTVTINLLYQYVNFASKNAGIDRIGYDSASNFRYHHNILSLDKETEIVVYNLAGQKVIGTVSDHVNLSAVPKGVYIATLNGQSIKIVR